MRLRRRYVPLIAALGIASAVLPAIASSETSPTVDAVNTGALYGHAWSPSQVSVMAGGVVTFRNASTEVRHGVEWVGGPATPTCDPGVPVGTTEAASGTSWSGSCTFSQAGTYTFYCTVHGPEMTGTVTVSPDGTTTTTVTTAGSPTTTDTTPLPKTEAPLGSPPVGDLSLRASQHGTAVRGSLEVSQAGAGARLEVDLLANSATPARAASPKRVIVGRFVHSSVPTGIQSFSVKLDAKARRALARHRRLVLAVRIVLTPLHGEPTTITRSVVEHP